MRALVRLLSTLLALAFAAAGAFLAIEVAWHWWRPAEAPLLVPWPDWRDRLAALTWDSTAIMLIAAIALVAGLLLLLAAIAARQPAVVMHDPADEVSVITSPRSLARLVGHFVRAQDNVRAASVAATAKTVKVRATSRLETEEQLRPRLQEAVEGMLGEVPLVRRPKVVVSVTSAKDRS